MSKRKTASGLSEASLAQMAARDRRADERIRRFDEWPRAETDCQCTIGDDCPCEADGQDGLCKCCRTPDGEHRGTCASEALSMTTPSAVQYEVDPEDCENPHAEFDAFKWTADGSPTPARAAARFRQLAESLEQMEADGYVFTNIVDNGQVLYYKPGDRCPDCGTVYEAPDPEELAARVREYEDACADARRRAGLAE